MLANFLGRHIAVIVGLTLSTTAAFGQNPSAAPPTRTNAASRPATVKQTGYGQSTAAHEVSTTPLFGAPMLDDSSAGCSDGSVGSGALPAYTGPANTYGPTSTPATTNPFTYPAPSNYPAPVAEGLGQEVGTFSGNVSNEVATELVVGNGAAVVGSAAATPGFVSTPAIGVPGEVPSYGYDAGFGGAVGDAFPMQIGPSPLSGNCARCSRLSFGVDYLNWYMKGQKLPELVSTSPVGTGPALAGRKYEPTTTILFGGDRQDDDNVSGFRVRGNLALDCCCCNTISFDFFKLNGSDFFFSRQTPGDYDILARPFYNPWTGTEDAEFVGYPGLIDGRVDVRGSSDFEGYGVWWRHNLLCCGGGGGGCGGGGFGGLFGGRGGCGGGLGNCGGGCGSSCGNSCGGSVCGVPSCGSPCGGAFSGYGGGALAGYGCAPRRRRRSWMPNRLDLIAGYRHLDLDESVSIREYLTVTDPAGPVPAGTTFDIFDSFNTRNYFDGFDFGLGWEWCSCNWGINATTKVAFGQLRKVTSINGFTNTTVPGSPTDYYPGGLLALPTNNGVYRDTDFTVVPEVGLNLHYDLNCHLRFNFGYTMIFFPEVVRPGGTIDLDVDPRQLPPPTVADAIKPELKDYEDDFWAQGFNVGLEYRF